MRKIFTAWAALFVAIASVKAQTTALFKMKYLPNHTYTAVTKMGLNIEMDYDADANILQQIKASGTKLPILMKVKTDMHSDLKTRAYNVKKEMPFAMNIQVGQPKLTINGAPAPVPDGASNETFYGKCSQDGKITIESIQGRLLTDSAKAAVMGLIKNIQANVEFPNTDMKIGDSFAQQSDMDVPVPGFDAKLITKVTYKLLSIINGKANFSMAFVINIDKNNSPTGMQMAGTGTGKLVFNINTKYAESMSENINLTYVRPMPVQKVNMKGTIQMLMDQQVLIK